MALLSSSVWACDVCSLYLSINPNDYKSSIGLHYRMRFLEGTYTVQNKAFTTKHLGHLDQFEGERNINEVYQILELRGQYFVNERIQLVLTMPMANNYRSVNQYTNADVYGIGDPVLLAKYQIFNTKSSEAPAKVTHRILAGGGVKVPLGSISKAYNGAETDIDMQPGTGSFDFFALAEYVMLINKRWGLNSNLTYKLNTSNKDHFRYGNVLASNLNFFSLIRVKSLVIQPALGSYLELSDQDFDDKVKLEGTGGTVFYTSAALNFYLGKFNWLAQFQYATVNALNADMLPNKLRVIAGINYNF